MDRLAFIPLLAISFITSAWMGKRWLSHEPECLDIRIEVDADSMVYNLDTIQLVQNEDVDFYTKANVEPHTLTWNFEGKEKEGKSVLHYFRKTGVYKVELVNQNGRRQCTYEKFVKVLPAKVAEEKKCPDVTWQILSEDEVLEPGQAVQSNKKLMFKATSEDVSHWYWNFDDGMMSELDEPYHTFEKDGIYKVTLRPEGNALCEQQLIVEVSNDVDHDEVPNDVDNCPNEKGSKLAKGCPDDDGDGVPNDNDNCKNIAGTARNFGCPERTTNNNKPDRVETVEDLTPNYNFPEALFLTYERGGYFGAKQPCDKKNFVKDTFTVIINPKRNVKLDHAYVYGEKNSDYLAVELLTVQDKVLKRMVMPLSNGRTKLSFKDGAMLYLKKNLTYKLRLVPLNKGAIVYSQTDMCQLGFRYSDSPFVDIKYKKDEVSLFRIQYEYDVKN